MELPPGQHAVDRLDLRRARGAVPHRPAGRADRGGRRDRRAVPGLPRPELDGRGVLVADHQPVVRAALRERPDRGLDRPAVRPGRVVQRARRAPCRAPSRPCSRARRRRRTRRCRWEPTPSIPNATPPGSTSRQVEQHPVDVAEPGRGRACRRAAQYTVQGSSPIVTVRDGARAAAPDASAPRARARHEPRARTAGAPAITSCVRRSAVGSTAARRRHAGSR